MNTDLATGNYVVKYSCPGSLRRALTVSLVNGQTTTGVNVVLKFGDLDGDNYVSQSEVDFIYSKVGQSAVFNETEAYNAAIADFDRDGTIENSEYLEANANSGMTGD